MAAGHGCKEGRSVKHGNSSAAAEGVRLESDLAICYWEKGGKLLETDRMYYEI